MLSDINFMHNDTAKTARKAGKAAAGFSYAGE